jgi:hypothetical protein
MPMLVRLHRQRWMPQNYHRGLVNAKQRIAHPLQKTKPQRVDWIRAKAPIADRVSFWLRTEALGEEGAFDGSYWM